MNGFIVTTSSYTHKQDFTLFFKKVTKVVRTGPYTWKKLREELSSVALALVEWAALCPSINRGITFLNIPQHTNKIPYRQRVSKAGHTLS